MQHCRRDAEGKENKPTALVDPQAQAMAVTISQRSVIVNHRQMPQLTLVLQWQCSQSALRRDVRGRRHIVRIYV
jgi:hypothetical protein